MLMIEDTLSREKTFDNTDETDGNSFMDESLIRLPRFKKAIYSAIGSKSYFALENLMSAYFNDLTEQVIVCYSRPISASKFGNHINRALTLFHFYWVDIKEQIDDNSSYLNKMTDIMGIYIDMELKAANMNIDKWPNITAKLINALHVYLCDSFEHICQVLFKTKLKPNQLYNSVCNSIFHKCFSNSNITYTSITDISYV